jgi:hypothetical protein
MTSHRLRRRVYLMALERGFLDGLLDRIVVDPFLRLSRALTGLDRRLCAVVLTPRLRRSVVDRPAEADEDRDE